MVSPINYTTNVLNPVEGYMQGLKFGENILTQRQGRELAQNQEARTQEAFAMQKEDRARAIQQQQARAAQAQAQQEQAERGQQALLEYLDNLENGTATPSDLRRAMVEFPQVAERFQAVAGSFSQERLANETQFGKQLSFALGKGNTETAKRLIQERLDAATASGDERAAAAYQSQLKMLETSPEALLTETLMPLVSTMPTDDFDKFYELAIGGQGDLPAEVRELEFRAEQGGLVKGTDEYEQFMLSGGASLGDKFRPATQAELDAFGADAGQVNTETNEFKPIRTGPETTVTNIMGDSEGTFAEEFSKKEAARVSNEIDLGIKAQRQSAQIDDLESVLSDVQTGAGASAKAYLGRFGIATEGLDLIQAAEAAINRLVPEQRAPGSGTMSDADLLLFKRSLPSLINQPGGNQRIIQTLRAMNEHDIALGVIASKVADYALTPKEDRAAAVEAGLILSPSAGRKASLELSDPLAAIRGAIGGQGAGDVTVINGVTIRRID